MRRFTLPLFALFATFLLLQSCNDDPNIIPDPIVKPNAANFKELRAAALSSLQQNDTINADTIISFTSAAGAILGIQERALLNEEGNAITGDVILNFIELYDRGNFLASNKPLLGLDENGNLKPLITAGEIFIEIKQDDKVLKLGSSYTLAVPAALTGDYDKDYTLSDGLIQDNGDVQWKGITDRDAGINHQENDSSYRVFNNQFGWSTINKFLPQQEEQTALKVTVPADYNYENAAVYYTFEGQANSLAQLTQFDAAETAFTEKNGNTSIGDKINVILISESKNNFVIAVKSVTIDENTNIIFVESDLKTTTLTNLISLVNGLE